MLKVAQKLVSSLANRGIRGTLTLLRSRIGIRYNEWRLGILTTGNVSIEELGLEECSRPYGATDYRFFRQMMRYVPVTRDDVFVDFGCGKGRVVVLAAQYPFRRVIGVELNPELCEQARRNVTLAKRLKCGWVDIIQADAACWPLPPEATVLYFFNPFRDHILEKVMKNIRSHLSASLRPLTIVYYNTIWFESEIVWQEWLDKKAEFLCDTLRCAIYTSKPQ